MFLPQGIRLRKDKQMQDTILPSTQYQVLHLRQVEKKSMEEIAGIIGITPASAATILSRARQRMLTEIRRRMEISRK